VWSNGVTPTLEERMKARRLAVLAAAALTAVGGAGAAIATTRDDDAKKAEQAVLADAAKRLNVDPSDLHDALAAAQDAQLDQAVKDGKLTQEQADAIKARRKESGLVLGFGPGWPHGPGMFFHHGFGLRVDLFDSIASAIGISRKELFTELRSGKSLAAIAKAHDKSLDDVKAAVRSSLKKKLDAAVKDGKLTQAQADRILAHVSDLIDHFGEKPPHMHRPGFGGPPPGFDGPRPGAYGPGDGPPPPGEGTAF
jgi:polyhydroxyalkanoate synthesis regulator phasin